MYLGKESGKEASPTVDLGVSQSRRPIWDIRDAHGIGTRRGIRRDLTKDYAGIIFFILGKTQMSCM